MNIRPTFVRVASLEDVAPLREHHLDGLIAAQDALLETLVMDASVYRIDTRDERGIGYFAVHGDATLVEFHVEDAFVPYAHHLLRQFIAQEGMRKALVKSFDHVFLACALDVQTRVVVRGVLVREFAERGLPEIPSIHYTQRGAAQDDLPRIRAVDQRVFTHPERLRAVVERGQMQLFEQGERLVGFGILRPVIVGRPDVELGIAVDRPFRNRGYAIYMLRDMARYCFDRGLRPVSGCSIDNAASIQMGLRVGFVSRYRLLELHFG